MADYIPEPEVEDPGDGFYGEDDDEPETVYDVYDPDYQDMLREKAGELDRVLMDQGLEGHDTALTPIMFSPNLVFTVPDAAGSKLVIYDHGLERYRVVREVTTAEAAIFARLVVVGDVRPWDLPARIH